jgi:hypothetical protein
MSVMTGADPDLLDELARELTASADRLRDLRVQLTARVRECPWEGLDADRIRAEWAARHDQAIALLATGLAGAADVVRRNAAEQRQASAAEGGGLVGGTISGPGDAPVTPGFPDLSVDGEGSFAAGPLTGEGSFDAGIRPKFEVEGPEFEAHGPGQGNEITDEEGKVVIAEAGVSAKAQASIADAEAKGSLDLGPVHGEGEASAFVGGEVEGKAEVKATEEGVVAAAGVTALAGVKAEAEGSVEAGGVTAGAEAHATAGLEFKAEAEAEFSEHKVGVSVELAAALGVGGGFKVDLSIDPAAAAEEIGDLFDVLDDW